MKLLALLMFIASVACLGQQQPQFNMVGRNPSGQPVLLGVDASGNLYTAGRTQFSLAETGYIPAVAPQALGTDGLFHYLQVDNSGNLKTSGGSSTPANTFYAQSGDTVAGIEAECSSPCTYISTIAQTLTLSSAHTLSANVFPVFQVGGKWTVTGGVLSLSNPVVGALSQHFVSNIKFAPTQKLVPVEWLGAQGGASLPSFDSTAAAQAAIDAITVTGLSGNGAQIEYQALYYRQDGTITFPTGVGLKGDVLGTQIWTTSATADQIHVFGALGNQTRGNVLENFNLWSTVTRTGTSAGVYLNHTNGVIMRNCGAGQSVYPFRIHDSGHASNGVIENCLAQLYVTDATTRAGWYLDSEDGVCNCSLFMIGDGTVVGQNDSNATLYGELIQGSSINDLVSINNGSSGTTTGLYVHYTGSGASDSASDLHIINMVNDTCVADCIHIQGLPSTGIIGGNLELSNGYAAAVTATKSAIFLDNSAGVKIHDMHIMTNAGYGIFSDASSNSSISGLMMMDSTALAVLYINNSNNLSIIGNIFNSAATNGNSVIYQAGGSDHNAYVGNVISGGNGSSVGLNMVSGTAVGTSTNVFTTAVGCQANGGTC